MATVTVTSKNFAFNDNGNHLRDASFSSYLSSGEEAFILKLGESTHIPTSTVVSYAESPYQLSLGRKYNKNNEIGIFTAEKYFSGGMDKMETTSSEKGWKQPPTKDGKIIDFPRPKKAFKWGTPSACSEASWNSQRALLQKSQSPNMQKQMSGKNFFSSFGCNCASKKSVEVVEKVGQNRTLSHGKKVVDLVEEPHKPEMFVDGLIDVDETRTIMAGNRDHLEFKYGEEMDGRIADKGGVGFKREDLFTLPNLNPVAGNHQAVGKQFEEAQEARFSLEVFGSNPSYMIKEDIGSKFHRKLTMFTSDPGRCPIKDVPVSYSSMDDGDVESEASSDLFEIESFSSKAHHPFFHSQDDMSCYEPSEASIEWSVVTASAANFSIASDYDYQKPTEKIITTATTTKAIMAKMVQRRQHTSLLGCRSSKAVTVAANAQRVSEKAEPNQHRQLQSDFMVPSARFQTQNRVPGFESAHLQSAFAMHTAHAPYSLYMH